MLQKAAEYIHSVQMSQVELKQEVDNYNLEIDLLSNEINNLQNNLPENGVSMLAANVNRTDSIRQKFDDFVKERSTQNWKFYIFSTILKPLFDN
jgi:MAX-like protein X